MTDEQHGPKYSTDKMHVDSFPLGIQVHQRAAEIAELRRKMETKQHPQILQACILAQKLSKYIF